jgi:translation initiation factor RLI1
MSTNASGKAAQIQIFEARTVPNYVGLDNSVQNWYNLFKEPVHTELKILYISVIKTNQFKL